MNCSPLSWFNPYPLIVLIGFSLLLGACSKEEAPPAAAIIRPAKVQVVGDLASMQRNMPGSIRADKRVELAFQVSGPLSSLPVEEGQEVKKGEVIAQILPRDFETNVNTAKASEVEAQQQYERYKVLYARNQVSKAQFDKAKSEFDIARANLKKAEDALADTSLRSPFSGVVAKRYVENFQEVRAKEPIISLQDLTRVEVLIAVPERLMAQTRKADIATSMSARFSVAPDRTFPLTLKEVAAQADPRTQTYQVVLVMDQPEDLNILPGMTATVSVRFDAKKKSAGKLVVPAAALGGDPTTGSFVWVVGTDNRVSQRPVKTDDLLGSAEIEILSGLESGETVVIGGVNLLREGMEIRPITEVRY